jgi:hypothetical protein
VAYAFLKTHTPLARCIRSLGLCLGFWALVLDLLAFPNLFLKLIIRSCFVIDKILSSSRPGIPDFGRYKMECLHILIYLLIFLYLTYYVLFLKLYIYSHLDR